MNHSNKNGIILIHQGTTDIMNHIGLLHYYSNKYDKLYLFALNIHEKLLQFIKPLNVEIIIFEKQYDSNDKLFPFINKQYTSILNSDYLFHGFFDNYRTDEYRYTFQSTWNKMMKLGCNNYVDPDFVNMFYSSYDIPVSVRIEYFIFERDYELENKTYDDFVQEYGDKYILYHSNEDNFINKKECKINLNQRTELFFDYIKILENSIEMHLLDSSWAAFVYLLDVKYRLFKDKKIYLYPERNCIKMFQDPIQLDNWVFI